MACRQPRGIALALVLLIVFVVTLLMFTLAGSGVQDLRWSLLGKQQAEAYYAAEAGVSKAYYAAGQAAPLTGSYTYNDAETLPDGASFTVSVTTSIQATVAVIDVTSMGTMGKVKKTINAVATVNQGWAYSYAFLGVNSLTLQGNPPGTTGSGHADSYNSATGQDNTNVANIGTNSSAAGSITIKGNYAVDGLLVVGPGGTAGAPTIVTSGGKPKASVLSAPEPFPTPTDPNGGPGVTNVSDSGSSLTKTLSPGQFGNVTLNQPGSVVTLSPGAYSFNSISVSNGASIVVSSSATTAAPVQIYLYGSYSVAGTGATYGPPPKGTKGPNTDIFTSLGTGMINIDTTQDPTKGIAYPSPRLLIFGMPTMSSVTMTGSQLFVGAFYAPWATVTLDGSGYYHGSIVGQTLSINGTNTDVDLYGNGDGNLTFDQALLSDPLSGAAGQISQVSWFSQ